MTFRDFHVRLIIKNHICLCELFFHFQRFSYIISPSLEAMAMPMSKKEESSSIDRNRVVEKLINLYKVAHLLNLRG